LTLLIGLGLGLASCAGDGYGDDGCLAYGAYPGDGFYDDGFYDDGFHDDGLASVIIQAACAARVPQAPLVAAWAGTVVMAAAFRVDGACSASAQPRLGSPRRSAIILCGQPA
jgi:hypothetical protein